MPLDVLQPIVIERRGLLALRLTLFMIAYNISVMPPIMPKIVREFGSSMGSIQGMLVLFSLVTAAFAPTTENLCRYYGRQRVFATGLGFYALGIACTSLSPNIGAMVVFFSFLTGLAATPLVSTPWAISDLAFEGKAEEQSTLALILSSTLGGLFGVLLGSYLASRYGWRWSFLPSLLVGLVIFLLRRYLPDTVIPRQEPIDWIGGLLSFLGLGSILVSIGLGSEYGWWMPKQLFSIAGLVIPPFALSIVPTLMAVGIICLGFFAFWQRQQSRQSGASLLRVGLLRKPVFVLGALTAMLHTLITTGVQFNLYQFLPPILGLNPLQTALTVIPYTLALVVTIVALLKYLTFDNQLPPRHLVRFGLTVLILGLGLLYSVVRPQMSSLDLVPGLVVMGVGSGTFLAYIGSLTYSVATPTEKPEGSGIYNPVQNLGSSLGRGILGTILISYTAQAIVTGILQNLGKTLTSAKRQESVALLQRAIQTFSVEERKELFAQLPASVQPALNSIINAAAIHGMRTSLLLAGGIGLLCLLLTVTLPKYVKRHPAQPYPSTQEEAL